MKWHHSLYWRIAAGFLGCLALLLLVQSMLFVWVVSQAGPTIPNQPPDRFAQTVALDVSRAFERDAALDLDAYIREEYARDAQPFFVVSIDNRVIAMGGPFPDGVVQEARARLDAIRRGGGFGRGGPFGRIDRPGFGRPEFAPPPPSGSPGRALPPDGTRGGTASGRGGASGPPGLRPTRPGPIFRDGQIVGLVVVPAQPPFTFLLSRYAPTLGLVAAVTLIVGAVLAAAVIFGPARARLRAVEDAARRLGAGDLAARAPSRGRDEVAAVATAFNAMADDLAARAQALAASDRARRQLLADVSHELTTPVTAMRGYLETLGMPEMALDDATRARYLAIIGAETGRLERIVGDLLDLAKLEDGGDALVVADVKVADVFAPVVERHERAAAGAGVAFTIAIEPGAEAVRGDRGRLEQAIQNLAANALRYAPAGTAITLGARRDGRAMAITVTDRGAGIEPDRLPYVFDRFYKADPSRAARPGEGSGSSGLGLSIVKAIAERHRGTVSVESRPGRTIFTLTLGAAEA
jgi:two-component system OmpR family sensor kinase